MSQHTSSISKPSKLSKPFQDQYKMSAATAAASDTTPMESIETSFQFMMLDDPIMKALWEGTVAWGDIPGICDAKSSSRRTSISSEESEPDVARICNKRRVSERPVVKDVLTERIVPAYTPGIKTVITRNLPRDVRVEQLRAVFEKHGPIKDIYIPKNMDKSSPYFGTIKGFALIKFLKPADSARAYENEYGRLVLGKNNITVEFAKEDR